MLQPYKSTQLNSYYIIKIIIKDNYLLLGVHLSFIVTKLITQCYQVDLLSLIRIQRWKPNGIIIKLSVLTNVGRLKLISKENQAVCLFRHLILEIIHCRRDVSTNKILAQFVSIENEELSRMRILWVAIHAYNCKQIPAQSN